MRLVGEFVTFHLSAEGQESLRDFFPDSGPVRAYVVDENDLGVWICKTAEKVSLGPAEEGTAQEVVPVILLKRQYFSTATLEMDLKSLRGFPQVDLELG